MATKKELAVALTESLKLQRHYATLLNEYDGGERRTFASSEEWIVRLKEIGTIKTKGELIREEINRG